MKNLSRLGLMCCLLWMAACHLNANDGTPDGISKGPSGADAQAIIGGAPDNRYPAIGALTRNRGQFCTGTLITPQLVITAAHCLSSGSMQFRIHRADGTTTYHDVKQQVGHPNYSQAGGQIRDDVALLILNQPVTGVTPIPASSTVMDQSWVGRQIQYLGYGLISTNPRTSTQKKYGVKITLRTVQSDRFMTQDSGKSICFGDSGGPALYEINGQLHVVGVNSYVPNQSCSGGSYCFRVDAYYKSFFEKYLTQYGGKCKTDADCGACRTCDVATGKCIAKSVPQAPQQCKACKTDTDCGAGNTCAQRPEGNRCLQACNASGCCPAGFSCNNVNGLQRCVPTSGRCPDVSCTSDADCSPTERCKNGICKRPGKDLYEDCSDTEPCLEGLTCVLSNIGRKICFRDCSSDSSCNPEGGKCYTSNEQKMLCLCNSENPCNPGYECKLTTQNGLCLPKAQPKPDCTTNTDCPSDQECKGGKCVPKGSTGPTCTSDSDCAQGYKCQNGTCVQGTNPPPGCTQNSDCPAGQICQNGTCVQGGSGGCTKDGDCPANHLCVGGQCLNNGGTTPQCTADADCLIGFVCQGGKCVQGSRPPCTQDSDCTVGFACVGGQCIPKAPPECTQDIHCAPGFTCVNEKCVAPQKQCTEDAHCPPGQICLGFQCIPGGNPGEERQQQHFDAGNPTNPNNPTNPTNPNNPTNPTNPNNPNNPWQSPFPPGSRPRQGCGCTTATGQTPDFPTPWLGLLLMLPIIFRRKR